MPTGFDLLYEEGPCLVVAKPGGLLTQAPPHIDSLEMRIKGFLKVRDSKPGRVYLGMPHRLDRPVSGVLVCAKHVRAARRLAEQFEGRIVSKTYWAMVEGELEEDAGTWTDYIRKVPGQALAEVVDRNHPDARIAILHYQVRYRGEDRTWLEIQLETGRTHQIRLQTSHRGHPILGDATYGAQAPFGPVTDEVRDRWIALHARRIQFRHPMTRETVAQQAQLPTWWSGFAETASVDG